jgi:hypothetical protein
MTRTSHGNKDLLIIAGLGVVAALVYFNQGTGTTGGGGGPQGPAGAAGQDAAGPATTIYQIPPAGDVTFPDSGNKDLLDMINKLLGGLGGGSPDATGGAKKTVNTVDLSGQNVYEAPSGQTWQRVGDTGAWTTILDVMKPAAAQVNQGGPSPAAGGDTASKKTALLGMSGQYVMDYSTGTPRLAWSGELVPADMATTPGERFGMSQGGKVPWQADIGIADARTGQVLYDDTTKKGNAMFVASQPEGVITYSPGAVSDPYNVARTNAIYAARGWTEPSATINQTAMAKKDTLIVNSLASGYSVGGGSTFAGAIQAQSAIFSGGFGSSSAGAAISAIFSGGFGSKSWSGW